MNAPITRPGPLPTYYRRTLDDGTVELFPANADGSMPIFPGTARGYGIEPVVGYTPYYGAGAHRTTLYMDRAAIAKAEVQS